LFILVISRFNQIFQPKSYISLNNSENFFKKSAGPACELQLTGWAPPVSSSLPVGAIFFLLILSSQTIRSYVTTTSEDFLFCFSTRE
jgi:hypothetical protein